jgi:hypothetical protein
MHSFFLLQYFGSSSLAPVWSNKTNGQQDNTHGYDNLQKGNAPDPQQVCQKNKNQNGHQHQGQQQKYIYKIAHRQRHKKIIRQLARLLAT